VTHAKIPPPPDAASSPRETHRIIRERNFPATSLDTILSTLRDEHSTGTLLIDISSGGVNSIRFREEQKIKFDAK
jgi:hypothetical protein